MSSAFDHLVDEKAQLEFAASHDGLNDILDGWIDEQGVFLYKLTDFNNQHAEICKHATEEQMRTSGMVQAAMFLHRITAFALLSLEVRCKEKGLDIFDVINKK